MAAGDKYFNTHKDLTLAQVLRRMVISDANGGPKWAHTLVTPDNAPTSTNPTVQAWINKITASGYEYPTQTEIDIFTDAFDYADAEGITPQLDLLGITQISNENLVFVPFIHSGGASRRFSYLNSPVFTANVGLKGAGTQGVDGAALKTNWIDFIDGINYILGAGQVGVYSNHEADPLTTGLGMFGASSTPEDSALLISPGYNDGTEGFVQIQTTINAPQFLNVTTIGLIVAKLKNQVIQAVKNGIVVGSDVQNILDTRLTKLENFFLNLNYDGAADGTSPYDKNCQLFFIGGPDIDLIKMNIFVYKVLNIPAPTPSALITTWYNSLAVKPSYGLLIALNRLVDGINTDGDWVESDFISLLAGMETDEQRLRPLKTTSGADLTLAGAVLPTLGLGGATGSASASGWLDLHWTPSVNGIKYTQNNASHYAMIASVAASNAIFGSEPAGNTNRIRLQYSGTITHFANCVTGAAGVGAQTGHHANYRLSATQQRPFRNGTLGAIVNINSTGLSNRTVYGLAYNLNGVATLISGNGTTVRTIIFGSNVIDYSRIRNRVNTFLRMVGLPSS